MSSTLHPFTKRRKVYKRFLRWKIQRTKQLLDSWRLWLREYKVIGFLFTFFLPIALALFTPFQLAGVSSMLASYLSLLVSFIPVALGIWIFIDSRTWRRIYLISAICLFSSIGIWVTLLKEGQDHLVQSNINNNRKAENNQKLRAYLIPANEPSLDTRICRHIAPPANAIIIFLGNSVAYTSGDVLNLIKDKNNNLLYIKKTPNGILINATLYDKDGKEAVRINNNVVTAKASNIYEPQTPDPHTLQIFNDTNDLILYVRYINPKAIKILGKFWFSGKRLWIEDEQVTIGSNMYVQTCWGWARGSNSVFRF